MNDPKSKKDFNAKYYGEKGKEVKLNNAEETKKVSDAIANADFVIEKVKRGQQKRNPQPPFTTSTLQQDASRKYNFQAAKTMQIAQTLYEGINLGGKIRNNRSYNVYENRFAKNCRRRTERGGCIFD